MAPTPFSTRLEGGYEQLIEFGRRYREAEGLLTATDTLSAAVVRARIDVLISEERVFEELRQRAERLLELASDDERRSLREIEVFRSAFARRIRSFLPAAVESPPAEAWQRAREFLPLFFRLARAKHRFARSTRGNDWAAFLGVPTLIGAGAVGAIGTWSPFPLFAGVVSGTALAVWVSAQVCTDCRANGAESFADAPAVEAAVTSDANPSGCGRCRRSINSFDLAWDVVRALAGGTPTAVTPGAPAPEVLHDSLPWPAFPRNRDPVIAATPFQEKLEGGFERLVLFGRRCWEADVALGHPGSFDSALVVERIDALVSEQALFDGLLRRAARLSSLASKRESSAISEAEALREQLARRIFSLLRGEEPPSLVEAWAKVRAQVPLLWRVARAKAAFVSGSPAGDLGPWLSLAGYFGLLLGAITAGWFGALVGSLTSVALGFGLRSRIHPGCPRCRRGSSPDRFDGVPEVQRALAANQVPRGWLGCPRCGVSVGHFERAWSAIRDVRR